MPESSPIAGSYLIHDLAQLKILADPLRVRILEALVEQARTTKQVAEGLGEKPTKLYHHVDALEKAGFIKLERTRQNRGTLEKYFRAVARVFRADPQLFQGSGGDQGSWQAISAQLFEQGASELLSIKEIDGEPEALVANLMVSASTADIEKLRERLHAFLEEISSPEQGENRMETEDADARKTYRLIVGFYPVVDSESQG